MATVNISFDVPADSTWSIDELVERVKEYALRLIAVPRTEPTQRGMEELLERIEDGEREVAAGGGYRMAENETGRDFVNRLLCIP